MLFYIEFSMLIISKKSIQVSELQKNISAVMQEITENPGTIYEVKKHKDPVSYVISPRVQEYLEDMLEEMDMMNDPELQRELVESETEFAKGGGIEWKEFVLELDEEKEGKHE